MSSEQTHNIIGKSKGFIPKIFHDAINEKKIPKKYNFKKNRGTKNKPSDKNKDEIDDESTPTGLQNVNIRSILEETLKLKIGDAGNKSSDENKNGDDSEKKGIGQMVVQNLLDKAKSKGDGDKSNDKYNGEGEANVQSSGSKNNQSAENEPKIIDVEKILGMKNIVPQNKQSRDKNSYENEAEKIGEMVVENLLQEGINSTKSLIPKGISDDIESRIEALRKKGMQVEELGAEVIKEKDNLKNVATTVETLLGTAMDYLPALVETFIEDELSDSDNETRSAISKRILIKQNSEDSSHGSVEDEFQLIDKSQLMAKVKEEGLLENENESSNNQKEKNRNPQKEKEEEYLRKEVDSKLNRLMNDFNNQLPHSIASSLDHSAETLKKIARQEAVRKAKEVIAENVFKTVVLKDTNTNKQSTPYEIFQDKGGKTKGLIPTIAQPEQYLSKKLQRKIDEKELERDLNEINVVGPENEKLAKDVIDLTDGVTDTTRRMKQTAKMKENAGPNPKMGHTMGTFGKTKGEIIKSIGVEVIEASEELGSALKQGGTEQAKEVAINHACQACSKIVYFFKELRKPFFIQANLTIVTAGMMYGWSSPALRKVNLSPDDESWVASILMYGGTFGCVITALLIDRIGRKGMIILTTVPNIISWALIYFSEDNLNLLFAARFIGGLSVGATYCVLPMYIGEISDDCVRGAMGSLLDLSLSLGILMEYSIGPYISFKLLAVISMIVPIINLLGCQFIPESPYYYCMKNKIAEARKNLQKLRGAKDVEQELTRLSATVTKEMRERLTCMKLFTKYGNRHAALIMFGLMTAQQFCGIGAIMSYTEEIFAKIGGDIDPRLSTIGVGVAQLAACVASALVADSYGRRFLLLVSSIGTGLCLLATGTIFYFTEVMDMDTTAIADLSIGCIILYMILVNIGLSSQTYVLLGELFPTNIKAVAVCISNLYMLLMEGVVTKMFLVITTYYGFYLSFWLFGVSSLISFVFIALFVPETKGQSLVDIQNWLVKNKPAKKNAGPS